METVFNQAHVIGVLVRFGIDIIALLVLIFGLYYRRYRDKELVTTAALFNIFVFAVLTVLSSVDFGIAAGFGLFAILALFRLRSESISKIEISYFFGSVALAVICSIQGTNIPLIGTAAVFVIIGAYFLDHPNILRSVDGVKVTLDQIAPYALSNPEKMRAELAERLGVQVMNYQITSFDYVNDTARIHVFYRKG